MDEEQRRGLFYAATAVFFFSMSPVLIRWAAPLSSYEIATGRLGIAALSIFLLIALRHQPYRVPKDDWPRFVLFGFIAALHFIFYIASLNYTTIAHSLAIVYTAPIFVTLFSGWFLGEPIPLRKWAGVLVAVGGVAVLVEFQPQFSQRMLIGDLMALGSAVMFGFYSIAGRSQRKRYPLLTYATTVYLIAALWATPLAAANFTPAGYHWPQILAVIGLGVLPLAFGHTLYNAALRKVHATIANLIATQEVTGGILLGVIFLGEVPGPNEIIGVIVTLVGIFLVLI